jgi:hypothetical protein
MAACRIAVKRLVAVHVVALCLLEHWKLCSTLAGDFSAYHAGMESLFPKLALELSSFVLADERQPTGRVGDPELDCTSSNVTCICLGQTVAP